MQVKLWSLVNTHTTTKCHRDKHRVHWYINPQVSFHFFMALMQRQLQCMWKRPVFLQCNAMHRCCGDVHHTRNNTVNDQPVKAVEQAELRMVKFQRDQPLQGTKCMWSQINLHFWRMSHC